MYLVSISNAFTYSHYFDFHNVSFLYITLWFIIKTPGVHSPFVAVVLGTPDVVRIGIGLFFTLIILCFSMLKGYGMMAVEEWTLNDKGEVESKNPSRYKIPEVGNLPRDFNVTLLSDSPNKQAIVYSSKVVIFYSYFCYKLRYLSHHVLSS